jgi:hypothetical protein
MPLAGKARLDAQGSVGSIEQGGSLAETPQTTHQQRLVIDTARLDVEQSVRAILSALPHADTRPVL